MKLERQQGVKRRFKTGQWVEYDGLYSDDWGESLVLVQGDLFPSNPQMGVTNWTYAGSLHHINNRSPKLNGHYIGY